MLRSLILRVAHAHQSDGVSRRAVDLLRNTKLYVVDADIADADHVLSERSTRGRAVAEGGVESGRGVGDAVGAAVLGAELAAAAGVGAGGFAGWGGGGVEVEIAAARVEDDDLVLGWGADGD